jgi:hypothetical protein
MINIWDKYPKQGTHFEAMQDKVKLHTWTYYVYYGRDRDDWQKDTVQASTLEGAIRKAQYEWARSGYTVWKKTFKLVDNQ